MNLFWDDTNFTISNDRVDGIDKVTGKAKYTAEHILPGLCYGVIVCSTIAKGVLLDLDTRAARAAPGVIDIIWYGNKIPVPGFEPAVTADGKKGREWNGLKVFHDPKIFSNGQPIALVIAESFEKARYAATLVKARYKKEDHRTNFLQHLHEAGTETNGWNSPKYQRGKAEAWKDGDVQLQAEYNIPMETHNPMEMHGIIAHWENDDSVKVYTKTQGPRSSVGAIAQAFQLDEKKVRVIAEYVGGGFGSALRTWPHEIAALMAAKKLKRPVKLVLSRDQMFTMVGYRPIAWQKISIGATSDGKFTGITHDAVSNTSSYENFSEGIVNATRFLYDCANINTSYKLLPLDLNTPIWMRGPGEATGCFALESAIDELAYKLNMDPIELRKRNYAHRDPEKNLPWSSKYLDECYALGADKIKWQNRPNTPKSKEEDGHWVGYGMGTGVFSAMRWGGAARATLRSDGMLIIQSAVSDMGPGTATAMVQIASETLHYPKEKIKFELGDSSFPPGPTQGGSATTSTLGATVFEICTDIKKKLAELAVKDLHDYLQHGNAEQLSFESGEVFSTQQKDKRINYTELMERNRMAEIVVEKNTGGTPELSKYSSYSFSVHFVKVWVHKITGVIRLKKIVTTGDAGKIVSPKTAESQMIGGVVGGIGMALMEETVIDHRYGRYINNNFADYHVPVHADVPSIEALFVNKPDPVLNPMGAKGMGEIALIGFAAAVANAVFNATGIRVRDLPITLDKMHAKA